MLPSKAVGRYSYQLVALSDMMETGAQGFPPKNGPPVFQAAEDKAPGLQPASVQQHGASAPKTLTAGAAGATGAASIQLMQYDPGHRHGDGILFGHSHEGSKTVLIHDAVLRPSTW